MSWVLRGISWGCFITPTGNSCALAKAFWGNSVGKRGRNTWCLWGISNCFTHGHLWRAMWKTLYSSLSGNEGPVVQMYLSGLESWHGCGGRDKERLVPATGLVYCSRQLHLLECDGIWNSPSLPTHNIRGLVLSDGYNGYSDYNLFA